MYIGFFNYYSYCNKNRMFISPKSPIGDDLMYPLFYLGQQLTKQGHKVNTIDMDDIKKFNAIVFIDFPTLKNKYFKQLVKNKFQNLYLITLESPIIKPDNYNVNNHKYFKKIFTWADNFVDNKKYFKINYSHKIVYNLNFDFKKERFCTIIASNKFKSHPQELYTEKIKAIRWFEKNHPEDFDLYGIGWDRYYFQGSFMGINLLRLNRLKFLAKLLKPNYPSYKGVVRSKKETYQIYKFAICYENTSFPGYITEKIFDCFFGSCIPVYLGAPNITKHIPSNTFIDKRKFKTYDELYKYIKNMPDKEYLGYLNAIENFIKSGKIYPFSAECFANTLIKEITNTICKKIHY